MKPLQEIKSRNRIALPLIRTVSFVLIFAILLYASSNIFLPKQNIRENGINYFNARGFLGEPEDSIDILAIGNSDLYSGFSPMVLWREYGYTSYVSGEARQTVHQAYNVLREALTCQSPKLVVIETDSIFEAGLSPTSINGTLTNFAQNVFPIVEFHDRWKSLTKLDFTEKPVSSWQSKSKGFGISNKVDPYSGKEYMVPTSDEEQLKLYATLYLNKMVDLCRQHGISVIFVEIPSANSWNYARHNAVADYAAQHNIPFFDMNLNRDTFGFNWLTDTRDKGSHLNVSGAEKVTNFLGRYISANYEIPDHRDDSFYSAEWNQALTEYMKKVAI